MKRKKEMFEIDPHPVIPPSNLLKQWEDQWFNEEEHANVLLIKAFQAGADEELEACVDWLANARNHSLTWEEATNYSATLRNHRRPKPPSLAEEGYAAVDRIERSGYPTDDLYILRRALERLQQLENNQ